MVEEMVAAREEAERAAEVMVAAMVAEMVAMDYARRRDSVGVLRQRDVLASKVCRCPQRRSWLPSIRNARDSCPRLAPKS